MAKLTFFKNTHYCFPFPFPIPSINKTIFDTTKQVTFNKSIKYYLDTDQSDVNKLFGFSYGFHHYQSDRIGFRYNPLMDVVEIVLYSYVQGKRIPTIHLVNLNYLDKEFETFAICLHVETYDTCRKVQITLWDKDNHATTITKMFPHTKKFFQYTLGGYFGGNRKAPQKITINVKNK